MNDFELWWKNFGQFLPPLDRVTHPIILEDFKRVAAAVWEAREPELDSAYKEGLEDAIMQK